MVAIKPNDSYNNMIIPIQHYAALHDTKFTSQPRTEMGRITNDFKRKGHAEYYSSEEIVQALASGRCAILSNFRINDKQEIEFVSSSTFAVDIDDIACVTNPVDVLHELKDVCSSLFYTFSHGVEGKGNRYRLFFQLDRQITDKNELKILIEYMIHYLQQKGLPADSVANNPTQVVRGGIKGYEVNSFDVVLDVDKWLVKANAFAEIKLAELEKKRKEREQLLKTDLLEPVTFEELKAMCEAIGYIPSGQGDDATKKWVSIVYALKNEVINGDLTDEEGEELYSIISGDEASSRYWASLKPRGEASVGTIVYFAKEAGHTRKHKYSYALREVVETIPTEVLKIKGHLTAELAKKLINRKQRLVLDSSTGSGKTTAFMDAFEEFVKENPPTIGTRPTADEEYDFFIFAAPTIPLTEQIANKYNALCIKGGLTSGGYRKFWDGIWEKINNEGVRIFVTTFDKTAELMSFLETFVKESVGHDGWIPKHSFTLVIDEIHKFTDSYNYRYVAIDHLSKVSKMATSVIGLSGTPEDLLKDDFDALIKIDNGNKQSPCMDFRVFTYRTSKVVKEGYIEKGLVIPPKLETDANLADVMLIPVVKGLLKQTRVLLFLNNKERITRIAKMLKKDGIKVQIVTSDTKQSSTYTNIVKNNAIDDDVQVLLSTSVIGDGISIKNGLDWTCLVVADKASPLFNPSTIKQISNRFRGQYRYFCLYIRELNPAYSETKKFQIESDFIYRKRVVENYVDYLNKEFVNDYLREFTPSKVEKDNGIYYRSTDDEAVIEYNPLFVRHQSMKRKESYYSLFRQAFINEVSKQLGVKCSVVLNVNDEAEKNQQDFSSLLAEIKEEQDQKKKEDSELREAFSQYFDESHYNCFVRGDEEALKFFKDDVHPSQYRSMLRVCQIADFRTCKQIGENIKKDADTHKYFNDIVSLVDVAAFELTKKTSVTKRVYNELLKFEGMNYFADDFKDLIENKIPKKMKVKPEDVTSALKLFHKFSSKKNGTYINMIKPLSIEILAKVRHKKLINEEVIWLDESSVRNSIIKYVYSLNAKLQPLRLNAITQKYGIKKYEK